MNAAEARLRALQLPGMRIFMHLRGLRGLRVGGADEDLTLRISVPDLAVLDRLVRRLGGALLALALFLVYVVMAVQYESLRNPAVILLGAPFAVTGVALGLAALGEPVSMPVWLGLIMLAGIVVNNTIILVEYIEHLRQQGSTLGAAIPAAAALRLRPILMTTLTTLVGLLPLALGWGKGAEMLRPLALTMSFGLGYSLLVSLLLAPVLYYWFNARTGSTEKEETS